MTGALPSAACAWRRTTRLVIAAVAMLACAACFGTPAEFQNMGVVVFRNETTVPVVDIRVSTCGGQDFGDNRLGAIPDVSPGEEFRLRLSPGCFDARVGFPGGGTLRYSSLQVRADETITVRIDTLPS